MTLPEPDIRCSNALNVLKRASAREHLSLFLSKSEMRQLSEWNSFDNTPNCPTIIGQ